MPMKQVSTVSNRYLPTKYGRVYKHRHWHLDRFHDRQTAGRCRSDSTEADLVLQAAIATILEFQV